MKKFFFFVAPVLWGTALFLPAYTFQSSNQAYLGYYCLLFGWAGGFLPFLAWLANILFWISYKLSAGNKARMSSAIFTGIAFVLSLSSLTITELLRDEAGHMSNVTISIGTYVWILSMLVLLVGSILKKQSPPIT